MRESRYRNDLGGKGKGQLPPPLLLGGEGI